MNTAQRKYIGPRLRLLGKSFTVLAFAWVLVAVLGLAPLEPSISRALTATWVGLTLLTVGEFVVLGGES